MEKIKGLLHRGQTANRQQTDRPMRGLGTDHVISGPMRGFGKKTACNGMTFDNTQHMTDGHCNLETELAQWADLVKILHMGDTESLYICR